MRNSIYYDNDMPELLTAYIGRTLKDFGKKEYPDADNKLYNAVVDTLVESRLKIWLRLSRVLEKTGPMEAIYYTSVALEDCRSSFAQKVYKAISNKHELGPKVFSERCDVAAEFVVKRIKDVFTKDLEGNTSLETD